MKTTILALILTTLVLFAFSGSPERLAREMVAGAEQFLNSLDADKQRQASFSFEEKERFNWHFTPRDRKGVPYKAMTPAQRKLAHGLLASGLSSRGMSTALQIMYLDQILFEIEKRPIRDPDLYYVTIFGHPSGKGNWGWRVEGHHLSLNFTLQNGEVISAGPAFFGANPAEVQDGPHQGLRVLALEEEMGRRLLNSFRPERRNQVIISAEAPAEIITGASRKAEPGEAKGIPSTEMTSEQAATLMQLIELYAERLRPELARVELQRLKKAGVDQIHFAWAGANQAGQPHYYRIQGPTFLIEYDNTQNNANHIHTVWRDLTGDFGQIDPLTEHYRNSNHH